MLETFEVSKVLIIAPLRVARDTWPAEIEKWDHLQGLDISVIVGDTKTRIAALHHPAMIYVINRENIKWLVEYYEKNGMRWDFGMPDCIPSRYEVEMSAPERELYDMLRKDLLIPLKDGDIDAANAASLTGKPLQMSNGAVYDENGKARVIHDHKLEALEDLIEAANGQPVLVAYWFKHDRQRIMEHLAKQRIPVRDIKSSTDIRDWNAGDIPVALIHPASAGHGLNIQQGGHILIWFGLTWSLELYQKTNARLWRQGQTDVVTIHHIITKDTVDEDVMAALEQKDMTQEKLISAVKAQLGR